MKTLLFHPEDSPRRGPWTAQRWDLVVDLGRSSGSIAGAWESELGCPIIRLDTFRRTIEDPRSAGQILRIGWGRLLDREGIDWWELTSLLIHSELETVLALQRFAPGLSSNTEIWATRSNWPIPALEMILGRRVRTFPDRDRTAWGGRLSHYQGLLRKFSPAQLLGIFLDKHDADFQWRANLSAKRRGGGGPWVLVPSAYTNVSRMAAAYAGIVPEINFLLVYTRASGKQLTRPENMTAASLASYAGSSRSSQESATLHQQWGLLKIELEKVPELELLSRLGILNPFQKWFSDGLAVRDAWVEVFRRESLGAVLCGDDSNWYTRLPVALARKRGLPTIDFHHGALDGRFLLKQLPSDVYLAKSPMEFDYLIGTCGLPEDRVVIGGPTKIKPLPQPRSGPREKTSIVFFSEPYEAAGGRPEEVYRELLPPLAALAADSGRRLIAKLHPFESVSDRRSLVRTVLSTRLQEAVQVVGGPLQEQLLNQTWFGVTVESTTVIECAQRGIACFIAGWLATSLYGYVQQFAKFGLGENLNSAEQLSDIPAMLAKQSAPPNNGGLWQPADPSVLRRLFARGSRVRPEPMRASES